MRKMLMATLCMVSSGPGSRTHTEAGAATTQLRIQGASS